MEKLEKLKKWVSERTKEAHESYIHANGVAGQAYAGGKLHTLSDIFDKIERMQREENK